MRNTIQKSLVIEAVNSLKSHPSADEIYQEVIKKNPTISRGTVYRNLGILADKGEILRVEVPNASDRFDFFTKEHYHFICKKCRKVFDIDMPLIKALDEICDKEFQVTGYDLIFKGLCKKCREEN